MKENKLKNERVIAFDLLRALAVILMIEGHTVHVFLDSTLREPENVFYSTWLFIRGFTAPLFMFTAGVVYVYLLLGKNGKVRLHKGFKRGASLILLGYLLRFPSFDIFRLIHATELQMKTFASVDALHIIGLGLIMQNLLYLISVKSKLNFGVLLLLFTFVSVFAAQFLNESRAAAELPMFFRAYFTQKEGTIFPLFPWIGFILSGGFVGFLLRKKVFTSKEFVYILSAAFLIFIVGVIFNNTIDNSFVRNFLIFVNRSSAVVILLTAFYLLYNGSTELPQTVQALGRNSLLIYVVHLVILYGSPISLGFYQLMPERLSLFWTIISVLVMEFLMIRLALFIEQKNNKFLGRKSFYGKISKYRSEFEL